MDLPIDWGLHHVVGLVVSGNGPVWSRRRAMALARRPPEDVIRQSDQGRHAAAGWFTGPDVRAASVADHWIGSGNSTGAGESSKRLAW